MVQISVVQEFGELEKDFGSVPTKSLQEIVRVAKAKDMWCLSFISFGNETRFNREQSKRIKKEIAQLEMFAELDKALLDKIEQAVHLVTSTVHLYLKFDPTQISDT